MLEFLMRIKLPLRLYDKMIVLNRASLLNKHLKVKIQVRLTDDDFEGGALPRNMSQLKDFMQGKGGATWSFTRGMKTGPTALTRQTIERPLKKIGKLAKMLKQ